jgi:YVTN family beta-propeller protein
MVFGATRRQARWVALTLVLSVALAGCGLVANQRGQDPPRASGGTRPPGAAVATANRRPAAPASPDVYAADRPGRLSPVVRRFPSRVYVPNSESGTVEVIDPATRRVVDQFAVGRLPQHVVPS